MTVSTLPLPIINVGKILGGWKVMGDAEFRAGQALFGTEPNHHRLDRTRNPGITQCGIVEDSGLIAGGAERAAM